EMSAVHGPAIRRMRGQPRIVIGFFEQVLRGGTLTIKPYERVEGTVHVSHKNPIGVLRGLEQLVLLGLFLLFRFWFLLIAQGDEAIRAAPPLRPIAELTLLVGIGARRPLPVGPFQLF